MASKTAPASERRLMTGELYGLKGWYRGGRCVSHIPRGEEIVISKNAQGKTCIFSHEREYPADTSLLYEARRKSKPIG